MQWWHGGGGSGASGGGGGGGASGGSGERQEPVARGRSPWAGPHLLWPPEAGGRIKREFAPVTGCSISGSCSLQGDMQLRSA